MINLNTNTRLNIILPSMNKALGEAIKSATPEQLELLKEGKDIKSLLTSVFQDKIASTKSDALLLDILKNSTVFKNMGNLTENLSTLIQELKTSDLSSKSAVLEKFLKNIATLEPQSLKSQITNSGVFMESKFAQALQKIPDLTQTLEQLRHLLNKNPSSQAQSLQTKITAVLESPELKTASTNLSSATQLLHTLKEVKNSLATLNAKIDPLYSKEVNILIQKLETSTSPQELKSSLSGLYGTLLRSESAASNFLLDGIEKLLKIAPTPQEIGAFADTLKTAIAEGDTTQEMGEILSKLSALENPDELVTETFLEKSLQNDLKSNLLSLADELKNAPSSEAPKLLEQTDKLLTQIDYHQITSYLNTSNSIYFPFSWDQLEEGSLAFKSSKNHKFYCEINLKLKEYGELNLMMALYDENQLEIQAHTETLAFKTLIQENLSELRSLLIASGFNPRTLRVLHHEERAVDHQYETDDLQGYGGFEVKA